MAGHDPQTYHQGIGKVIAILGPGIGSQSGVGVEMRSVKHIAGGIICPDKSTPCIKRLCTSTLTHQRCYAKCGKFAQCMITVCEQHCWHACSLLYSNCAHFID